MTQKNICSGGEDFKIIVYDDQNKLCSLPHPSVIWNLFYHENFEILYSFGEDGILRLFTTDMKKIDKNIHAEFIEKSNISTMKNPDFQED